MVFPCLRVWGTAQHTVWLYVPTCVQCCVGCIQYRVGQGVTENIDTFQHTVGRTPVVNTFQHTVGRAPMAGIKHMLLFSTQDTHKRERKWEVFVFIFSVHEGPWNDCTADSL